MEMSYQGGVEAEGLLRPDGRRAVHLNSGLRGWDGGGVEGEKAPFLRNEPVRLTPAWEGANLPNDTLNLKGVGMELAPPRDKWNLIYLTMVLHGLGTLTAWNMFITARPYFMEYKLADSPEYYANYLPFVGFASQVPNLLFSWFNVFVRIGGDLTTRIVCSLIFEVLIFVVTVVLAMMDTSEVPAVFFWLTIGSVFLLNGFNAIFQNSVYGVAARLPPAYTGAVVLGSNVCGTLVVALQWASESFGGTPRTAAIYYFIGGIFVLLVCLDTYFALPLNRFYRYHDTIQRVQYRSLRGAAGLADAQSRANAERKTPYCAIVKQCWVQLYNVFIIFFVTLAVFPIVHSDIYPVNEGFLGSKNNFTRLTCFLTFNLMALIGNISASLFLWPTPRWLWVFSTFRILMIPFFLLCNYVPKDVVRTLPVLIQNDWTYWGMAVFLGWSSGHGSSLGMMYASKEVASEHAATAGMISGATLCTGIVAGIAFSYASPALVGLRLWGAF